MLHTRDTALPADWVSQILSTRDMQSLSDTLSALVARLGFTRPTYGLLVPSERALAAEGLISSYDPAWLDRYFRQGYLREDPVIVHGLRRIGAFAWREIPDEDQSAIGRQVLHEAMDFGIDHGLTVSIRGGGLAGLFSALADGSDRDRAEALSLGRDPFTAVALVAHEQAARLRRRSNSAGPLTRRERECVQWLAAGKTGTETADILGISDLTVNQHIKAAMRKLGCSTRAHLAARAVVLGLVDGE